mmetsp:Transcript_12691/g.35642  ORF Transcript_12691/g.35642 Transcript_12691/m.35642 type:complete len:262 (-) Transcript_12691:469-1254(-)
MVGREPEEPLLKHWVGLQVDLSIPCSPGGTHAGGAHRLAGSGQLLGAACAAGAGAGADARGEPLAGGAQCHHPSRPPRRCTFGRCRRRGGLAGQLLGVSVAVGDGIDVLGPTIDFFGIGVCAASIDVLGPALGTLSIVGRFAAGVVVLGFAHGALGIVGGCLARGFFMGATSGALGAEICGAGGIFILGTAAGSHGLSVNVLGTTAGAAVAVGAIGIDAVGAASATAALGPAVAKFGQIVFLGDMWRSSGYGYSAPTTGIW